MKLIIASHNLHKILEIRTVLKKLGRRLDLLSLIDFPGYEAPDETGSSFEENARIKAIHASKTLGEYVLADDSGLVVPALNGEPGVYSARYAGHDASDKENRQKLIERMKHLIDENRSAYYTSVMVLASPEKEIKIASGIAEGRILISERGSHGFGYDSLFVKEGYSSSFAEMPENIKYEISHRRKALEKVMPSIEMLLLKEIPNQSRV